MHKAIFVLFSFALVAVAVEQPAARAQSERPVMAFYYPWWEYSDWSYERMSDLPAPQYAGGETDTIRRHIEQADDAGIDALICTWYGPNEKRLNERCQRLQDTALEMGSDLQIAVIPDQSAWQNIRSVDGLTNALAALERDFISKPNYLRFRGKPAVFWFNPPSFGGVATWQALRERADPNREQFWFGGTDDARYLAVYDTLYFFDITWERAPGAAMAAYADLLADTGRPFVATVMPGYDDLRLRNGHARDRKGGDYYRGTWQTAIDSNADAVVLTSFNEFFEGSHIEPSERYGDLYLQLTKELSAKFRADIGQRQPAPPAVRQGECRSFAETGFEICGRLLEYWNQNGGLPVFGYPISNQRSETIEGQVLETQEFERNRLELHPENGRPYDVLLGRLGSEVLLRQARNWQDFGKVDNASASCRYFAETGHSLCEPFLSYWRTNGVQLDGQPGLSEDESLALFGLPLSEPQPETLSDGNSYTVQWFERARFEYHPDNPEPYRVLLGLLGVEVRGAE